MQKDAHNGDGIAARDAVPDADAAFEMLRAALLEVVDGKISRDDLRAPVRRLCVVAHSEEMPAEQLLIRFKEIWAGLPQLAGLPRGRQRNDLMAQLATMCIEEYYRPSPDRAGPPR